uniref:Putative secreted protein n=1 Tax=Anopheles darlingi TaxID=43151 RepID=A0A2M4DM50_ANODA
MGVMITLVLTRVPPVRCSVMVGLPWMNRPLDYHSSTLQHRPNPYPVYCWTRSTINSQRIISRTTEVVPRLR